MFNRERSSRLVRLALIGAVLLASCSAGGRRDALCQRAAGLGNEFALVDQTLQDLANATPSQIENTLLVVRTSIANLLDLGPIELKGDFAAINDTYDTLALALTDVGYDGAVALSDSAVDQALQDFSKDQFVKARTNILEFVAANCEVNLQLGINELNAPNTTLPNPVLSADNAPDPTTGFDNDDSVDAAYGYYVAQQYGLAITNAQALCLGRALTTSALKDLSQSDNGYAQLVNDSLKLCGVDAVVAK